ncbi:MAG: sugar phosphate isomerase/epimerase [Anaerolineae bacterium]|nr:sugar phosphate isomerase/epimerase [Anaerolineae bacterium]
MKRISFVTANYIARQAGYNLTGGWGAGDQATQAHFKPVETFAVRFEEILLDVRAMGFEAMDLWLGHLHWAWATDEHIAIAKDLFAKHGLAVASLAGGFGDTAEEFEKACKLAVALDTGVLGGMAQVVYDDRPAAVKLLKQYDLKFGIENHAEKTPDDLLANIGDGGDGMIGAALDTGNFGSQGFFDPAEAVEKLAPHIVHVHLKDIVEGHKTCRFGQGRVPVKAYVEALEAAGYRGFYAVEHEPFDHDPTEASKASLVMLREWLAG